MAGGGVVAFRPGSVGELCEALTEPGACWIEGSGSSASFRVGSTAGARTVRLDGLSEIVDLDPANQVAVVQAGASLQKLQTALETVGHCLPYDPYLGAGTVGGALSMNLPHGLEAKHGSWRDWVLGLTVARPDGKLARCGSRVVKNVAGYDVAKMFVGARGWLGVVAEVILRTFPRPHPPAACLEQGAPLSAGPLWIQRTLPQDAIAAREAAGDRLC
ncbi:MAG: FAD-binding oxidoreductase, partial [Fimbriimonas ginsengisoli]|nr:FAD-binding oxidoreductase [Fimbriimonas ginsengisoli]